jgi:hypothetical protein
VYLFLDQSKFFKKTIYIPMLDNIIMDITDRFSKQLTNFFFCILTEHPSKTEIFLSNYINQFQCILTFIRATRENNVILHLEATRALLEYFFSNNNFKLCKIAVTVFFNDGGSEAKSTFDMERIFTGKFVICFKKRSTIHFYWS